MADPTIVIGNVTFNKTEVLNSRKINEEVTCGSGQLWEVQTISGTFRFRDVVNGKHNANTIPTIFSGQIKNCTIESMNGTKEGGIRYAINNSNVGNIDLSNGKRDFIHVDQTSNVRLLEKDPEDNVQVQENNQYVIKRIENMHYWEY